MAGDAVFYAGDQNAHTSISFWLDGVFTQLNASDSIIRAQQPLWSRENLGPGDHELLVRHEGVYGTPIALDFLRVEYPNTFLPLASGPAASIVPSEAVIVDNAELDLVEYSPTSGWICTAGLGLPYNNTLHTITQPGANITFKFNGTAVWYFSNTDFNHGKVHVSLDGVLGTTVVGFSTHHLNQRLLWSATDLADGEHTVVITHADTDDKVMALDFFRYLPSRQPVTPSPQTITSTIVVSEIPAAATAQITPEYTKTDPDWFVRVVIGSTLGGVVLLALIVAFIYWRCYSLDPSDFDLLMEECKPDHTISPYGYSAPYIVIDASSSAVFSEPRISDDTQPLIPSTTYLTPPRSVRSSIVPTIGSLASVYHARTRSASALSDVSVISAPPLYR
ncbi:hypothetical protein FRC09_003890 [Ceratobasidium sp. 395]|nr:hypothetical protein FRC09_003890 [Ceratobasidium sp. 395]